MDFYVVSPNIWNNGDNFADEMLDNNVVEVGWSKDKQKGVQFSSIKNGDCIVVALRQNWKWTYYYLGIVKGDNPNPIEGKQSKFLTNVVNLQNIDLHFENWSSNGSSQIPSPQRIRREDNEKIIKIINEIINQGDTTMPNTNDKIAHYQKLLQTNNNLILTGAPGTGKTHLAKEIAKAMDCTDDEIGFVQFYPSYDYTDFVEGLRPDPNNNRSTDVPFIRMDGVFKEFCKRAVENIKEYEKFQKTKQSKSKEIIDVQEILSQYFEYLESQIIEQDEKLIDFLGTMKIRKVTRNKQGAPASIEIAISADAKARQNLTANIFYRDYINFKNGKIESYRDVKPTFESKSKFHGNANYYFRLYELVTKFEKSKNFDKTKVERKDYEATLHPFVFIIDEINRGEISKIFGELFFSIDPGYRGVDENGKPKGLVQTQYQNLVDEDDDFFDGFYVPENVYIIGTMNDIDRSVESMDFAFRRRFAFAEVKAKDTQSMLDKEDAWKPYQKPDEDTIEKIKNRMNNLNKAISDLKDAGLSSAYHIGASYFLKLQNYDGDFEQLWKYHLEGLLFEYLRGNPDSYNLVNNTLKVAYDDDTEHNENKNAVLAETQDDGSGDVAPANN